MTPSNDIFSITPHFTIRATEIPTKVDWKQKREENQRRRRRKKDIIEDDTVSNDIQNEVSNDNETEIDDSHIDFLA